MRTLATIAALTLTFTSGACLEGGLQGGAIGQIDAGAQADTPTGDAQTKRQPDVKPPQDVAPVDNGPRPSCPFTCDDGDPCTADDCDEATGACLHAPAPEGTACGDGCGMCFGGWCQWPTAEPPECYDHADCDDGDPCTEDICAGEVDACYSWAWCEHVTLDGCGVSCPGGCDDGDPCTDDWCTIDGACANEPMWECAEVPTCSGAGATSISEVLYNNMSGQLVKVPAIAAAGSILGCPDSDCGGCVSEMWLVDPDMWMGELLAVPGLPGEAPYTCFTGGCEGATMCSPMQHEARYWVWGIAEEIPQTGFAPQPGGGGEDVAYYPMRLNVEGYCLQTTPAGLPGQYVGQLDHNYGYTLDVSATVSHGPSGYTISLSELACEGCFSAAEAQDATAVTVGDGWLSFSAGVPDGGDVIPSVFDLVSDRNELRGDFWADGYWPMGGASGDSDGVMMPPGGTLRLTRVQ